MGGDGGHGGLGCSKTIQGSEGGLDERKKDNEKKNQEDEEEKMMRRMKMKNE